MGLSLQCGHGTTTERRHRLTDFSPQGWSLLVQWQEVSEEVIQQPLCEVCYQDIREILIERSGEMERALATGQVDQPMQVAEAKEIRKATAGVKKTVKGGK